MIVPNDTIVRILDWLARRFGPDLGLPASSVVDSLDEHELSEQLHFGRD